MKYARATTIALVVMFLGIVGCAAVGSALYTVDESEYGLELRFGEVQNVRRSPGLYLKAPFIDSVQFINKKTLRADIPRREVPDRDKERLDISYIVRYAIADPVAFRKTLRNEATAEERIASIMFSAMRDTIAGNDRTEVIGARPLLDSSGNVLNDEEGLPRYESLVDSRDRIGDEILERIRFAVTDQDYGIEIISADIKRADFPSQVTQSIIDRLISERRRVAEGHRADGEREYLSRNGEAQKRADIILAEARRDARQIRGEGDAEAIRLVQQALTLNPEFYRLLRTLESYETSISSGATVILTASEGGYLERLVSPPGQ